MPSNDFIVSIQVAQTPEEVFSAINNVRSWWSGEIVGKTDVLGEEFTYQYKDLHRSVQKITELIPAKRIVWRVIESNITFAQKKDEWTDTEIIFEIQPKDGQTAVHFTHKELSTDFECYEACSSGWNSLITENLKQLIENGNAQPDVFAEITK